MGSNKHGRAPDKRGALGPASSTTSTATSGHREHGQVDNRQTGPLEVRGHLSLSQDGRSRSPPRLLELVGI